MNQREEQANIKIKHLLDCTLFNPDIADSMKYFKKLHTGSIFFLAFMYEAFKEKEITQEDAIQVVPSQIASRATRVTELKKAVRAGYIIEKKSTKDKRARIYKPSDEMLEDFLNLCDQVFFAKV